MAKIFVFVGPSGAGKTTIAKALNMPAVLSVTTRPPREGEKEGRDYRFISEAKYMELRGADELLEDVNNYGFFYGITKTEINNALEDNIHYYTIMTYEGIEHLRPTLPEGSLTSIFIYAPFDSINQRLIERVRKNKLTIEAYQRRMLAYPYELNTARKCDYIVASLDGCLDVGINTVRSIVQACK